MLWKRKKRTDSKELRSSARRIESGLSSRATDALLGYPGLLNSRGVLGSWIETGTLHPENIGSLRRLCRRVRFVVMNITYRLGNDLDLDSVIELYRSSTLGERRPVDDRERMKAMLDYANLVITGWDGDRLLGISRSFTDFVYATYLSDLAVRSSYQRQGIGKELVRQTQLAAPRAMIILLAAPAAEKYYPRIGFTRHPQAWILRPGENVV
jgi:GNAT superfamily N-acetyltransferase